MIDLDSLPRQGTRSSPCYPHRPNGSCRDAYIGSPEGRVSRLFTRYPGELKRGRTSPPRDSRCKIFFLEAQEACVRLYIPQERMRGGRFLSGFIINERLSTLIAVRTRIIVQPARFDSSNTVEACTRMLRERTIKASRQIAPVMFFSLQDHAIWNSLSLWRSAINRRLFYLFYFILFHSLSLSINGEFAARFPIESSDRSGYDCEVTGRVTTVTSSIRTFAHSRSIVAGELAMAKSGTRREQNDGALGHSRVSNKSRSHNNNNNGKTREPISRVSHGGRQVRS